MSCPPIRATCEAPSDTHPARLHLLQCPLLEFIHYRAGTYWYTVALPHFDTAVILTIPPIAYPVASASTGKTDAPSRQSSLSGTETPIFPDAGSCYRRPPPLPAHDTSILHSPCPPLQWATRPDECAQATSRGQPRRRGRPIAAPIRHHHRPELWPRAMRRATPTPPSRRVVTSTQPPPQPTPIHQPKCNSKKTSCAKGRAYRPRSAEVWATMPR